MITQYNVPRYLLHTPGKQNRTCTGEMYITPGMTEVFDFQYNNIDGIPINLTGFNLRLMFWFDDTQYESLSFNMNSNIVLTKDLIIDQSYKGIATILLTDQETLILGTVKKTLNWSVFFINQQNQVFPAQITADGRRYGIVHIDDSNFPISDIVLSTNISPTFPINVFSLTMVLGGLQANTEVGSILVTVT